MVLTETKTYSRKKVKDILAAPEKHTFKTKYKAETNETGTL